MSDDNFKRVVKRIYELAQSDQYENDLNTNIQAIFNRLDDDEQKDFLSGLVPFILKTEEPPIGIVEKHEEFVEDQSLEEFNQYELIRLKSWLVKCLAVMVGFFLSILTIYILIRLLHPVEGVEGGPLDEIERFIEALMEL